MKRHLILVAALVVGVPAYADTDNSVTLVLENDAGLVTTVPGLTRHECDAAAALLADRGTYFTTSTSLALPSNTWTGSGVITALPSASPTSRLRSTKCMTATDKK